MKKYRGFISAVLLILLLGISACGREKEEPGTATYKIYYVNKDRTAVMSYDYKTTTETREELLIELLAELAKLPAKLEFYPPLAGNFKLNSSQLSEGQLLLDFSEEYKNQEVLEEILTRAAIVRTLSQVKDIYQISFSVMGEPLTDASGAVVGMMRGDSFIDNAGNEISAYETMKLKLYFANENGDGLTFVNRNVVYNSNFSVERQVVEEIIAGPKVDDIGVANAHPVMNGNTKVISVNIRDGICYVNLNEAFLNPSYQVVPEVTIYAITNSLVELGNVNKVQILVNGETNVNYQESISLSTIFERNLDLINYSEFY